MRDFLLFTAPLVEKYRPTDLSNYIFQNDHHRTKFTEMIESKNLPCNILLSGTQGCGKSTIARMIIASLPIDQETDVLSFDGSTDNKVEFIRERIENFVTLYSESPYRVVYIEEADRLSKAAQKALKVVLESYIDIARFVVACNHEHLLDKAFKSRFQQYRFTNANTNDIALQVAKILSAEGVAASLDLIDKFVALGYPDIRQTIHLVEQHIVNGRLVEPSSSASSDADWKVDLLETISNGDWKQARSLLCGNVSDEEWDDVYTFMYRNIHRVSNWSAQQQDSAIVTISQHLYQHSLVADPEINAAAMLINLQRI